MSNPSALGAIEYEAESAWAEDVNTFATHRLPVIGEVDTSGLVHNMAAPEAAEQYRGAGSPHIPMTQGGSFRTRLDLAGHGSTMVGSPSLDAIETFLGIVFGNVSLSAAASTTLTGGTVTAPTTTASGTFAAGGLCRIGARGDGDGEGQFYAVSTHATTTLNLANALAGTPVNGAVLYPVAQVYESSSPTDTSITGTRFRLLTANYQYQCHGCWPMSVTFTGLSPSERPQIEIEWGVSRWSAVSATFPSAVASNRYVPSPVAAGALHVNTVGTATRALYSCRNFSLTYALNNIPEMGPGGVSQYQAIVGAVRGVADVTVSFTVNAGSATATPTIPGWATNKESKFIVYTLSTTDGSAVGFKFPKVCPSTIPVQRADGGINRITFEGKAYCSDTTTSALTLARMVLGLA